MLGRGRGSIVNICSIMGHGANELNVIAYTAAKGGLRNITLQLGCEWADRGVRVNSVSPGFIVTEMVRPALEGMGMDRWIASRTPMRRIGELEEIVGRSCSSRPMPPATSPGTTSASTAARTRPTATTRSRRSTMSGTATPHRAIGSGYAGVQPRPDWYQAMAAGIPGVHYEPVAG